MTSIQPELWVEGASAAVVFYQKAFDAVLLHRVGHEVDTVAQLAVGTAQFWVTEASSSMQRFSPEPLAEPRVGRCSWSMIPTRCSIRL
jgi:uncharacterized glyoxalase superfamily protein PhnB